MEKTTEPTRLIKTCCICPECGGGFLYLPGDVESESHEIYNVPEEFWKKHGGEYGPIRVDHVDFVRCPWCKSKCEV